MRTLIELTDGEKAEFRNLAPEQGKAFDFWKKVAAARKLDYRTIMTNDERRTALPAGHGKHWCFPFSLKCKSRITV